MSTTNLRPVAVGPEAFKYLSDKTREWSGWRDGTLRLAAPDARVSNYAMTDHTTRRITVDVDKVLLNPNRVLRTANPFRLRQEAVLTGVLLHEAGHARHSHWYPRTVEGLAEFKHHDGEPVTPAEFALSRIFEEVRVETLMALHSDINGAEGLEWTMRAMAAYLLPMTEVSTDPEQAIMDLITSWALRAGRPIALHRKSLLTNMPPWVSTFTAFMKTTLVDFTRETGLGEVNGGQAADLLWNIVAGAAIFQSDTAKDGASSTWLVECARDVLRLLFGDNPPEASGGCGESCGSGAQSGDESGEQGESGGESPSEAGDAGEGESEDEDTGATGSTEADDGEGRQPGWAKALAGVETNADETTKFESKSLAEKVPSAGGSNEGTMVGGWRQPEPEERVIANGAERFLRDLINPTESLQSSLSEVPSAMVDGAALSAWRASGATKEPRFFIRSRREVRLAPPVKIAILVDISDSMKQLQKPSALLSWALANAAVDLRNFAGRGVQIESTLIHWGTSVRVVQRNGESLPGIREVACNEGTTAMDVALDTIESQIPGFFSPSDPIENRLLVQFTDWQLHGGCGAVSAIKIEQGAAVGVNMLSVVPHTYSGTYSQLPTIERKIRGLPGRSSTVRYDPRNPGAIWAAAARMLG